MIYGEKFLAVNEIFGIKTITITFDDFNGDLDFFPIYNSMWSYEDFDSGCDPLVYFKSSNASSKDYYTMMENNNEKLKELKDELKQNCNGKSLKDAMITKTSYKVTATKNGLKKDKAKFEKLLDTYNKYYNTNDLNNKIKEYKKELKDLNNYKATAKDKVKEQKMIGIYINFRKDYYDFYIEMTEALIYATPIVCKGIKDAIHKLDSL